MTDNLAQTITEEARPGQAGGAQIREQILAGLPVTERQLSIAGVSTAVLEGGDGPPMVLLHGPGEYAAKWLRVIPDLVSTYHVVAPDLPSHGNSGAPDGELDADRVLAWLAALIEQTCAAPPVLVGQILGGAIAARFASVHRDRISGLVLVDALGLAPFQPAPEFGQALMTFLSQPTAENHDLLWQKCAYDLDRLRDRMGESWERVKAYNLDRAQTASLHPGQQSLMEQFGFPPIPPEALAQIAVPTTLIWGRHDLATALQVAEDASTRFGWSLHIVEAAADDPPMEQPEAFLQALHAGLEEKGRRP